MAFGLSAGAALAIGAGAAGLAGAYMQSEAAGDAAHAQSVSANEASQLQRQTAREQMDMQERQFAQQQGLIREQMSRDNQIYNETIARNEPGRQAGLRGLTNYEGLVNKGFQYDPNAFATDRIMNDPGMKFRLDQGNKSAMRSLNAGPTGTYSGAAAKALLDYNQGAASQEYGAAYGRAADAEARRKDAYQLQANQYANLAGIGQTSNQASQVAGQAYGQAGQNATNAFGQAGSNFVNGSGNALGNMANAVGGNMIGAGNAQAANSLYQGNTWGNAFNQAASAAGKYFSRSQSPGGGGYGGWSDQFGLNGSSGVDGW